jgi:hypothetical protein
MNTLILDSFGLERRRDTIELTDKDLYTIRNALANSQLDCVKASKMDLITSACKELFEESAAEYRAVLDKLE